MINLTKILDSIRTESKAKNKASRRLMAIRGRGCKTANKEDVKQRNSFFIRPEMTINNRGK